MDAHPTLGHHGIMAGSFLLRAKRCDGSIRDALRFYAFSQTWLTFRPEQGSLLWRTIGPIARPTYPIVPNRF
jgi:hypothetical protein